MNKELKKDILNQAEKYLLKFNLFFLKICNYLNII